MTIHEILLKYWQYPSFRPLQESIIQSVIDGNDTLALLPTGGGKSLCFQVPAMLNEGICIVITPLIALMKDQVENLRARKIEAIAIFSGMGKREVDIALDNCIYGKIKFLYLSPERLMNELVQERIRYMNVNLIAVDEAHCISHWGYDFRPAYLQISVLREIHPGVPVLALTATAIASVVKDIQEKLHFDPARRRFFKKSFFRENLAYMVLYEENKMGRLLNIIHKVGGTGIIYVRNRRETQEVARYLVMNNIQSDYYHAGLSMPERTKKQKNWKNNKIQAIVATNAFGMGIDKPDVRFVIHIDLPESLEAYYQEAGRAGRDGLSAYAVLLHHKEDHIRLRKSFEVGFPTPKEIAQVYFHLGNYYQLAYGAGQFLTLGFDLADFCRKYQLDPKRTVHALKFLEHDEWIALSESVFLSSRLRFEVDAPTLYRFQVEYASLDLLIKTILRSYGSAFDLYVEIHERDIARKMGISFQSVIEGLQKMQELEIISYLPQTDEPQLTFLQARVDTVNLHVDHQYIRERKQVMEKQIQAVFSYVETSACRSRTLLAYFDDVDTVNCGICDTCIKSQKKEQPEAESAAIKASILLILSKGPQEIQQIINKIEAGEEETRIEVLRRLVDSGEVKITDGYYHLFR